MSARTVFGTLVLTVATGAVARLFPFAPPADAARLAARQAAPPPAAAIRLTTGDTAGRVQTGRTLVAEHLGESSIDATGPRLAARRPGLCSYVVIVPDPIDSRLDWQFDAGVEATKRAFEASGFVLERFWLPWTVDADSTLRKRARDHEPSALRRDHPGVLLFRPAAGDQSPRAEVLAVVYLVPETPTSGIRRAAFDAALADRQALLDGAAACPNEPRGADELRVIGPTFSGTIESLRHALDGWVGLRPTRHVTVISGGATSARNRDLMQRGAAGRIAYSATINPVSTLLATACQFVLDGPLHVAAGEVAMLTEGSTTFGRSVTVAEQRGTAAGRATDGACARSLIVPFPMSISRLRAEYARHPASSTAPSPVGRAAPRIPLDLEDPASAFESPPAFSDLTAPAVERVMDDIGQTLLAHRTRVVIIAATDVRDRVFVADEIRRRLRDVRLVIVGAHALFLRSEFNTELRGALVLSTYPLFTENQFWTVQRADDRERFVFTNELAEGAYNATLFQLAPLLGLTAAPSRPSDVACDSDTHLALSDYRPPHAAGVVDDTLRPSASRRPPVWLTVVGRTTIAPVRAYPVTDQVLARSDTTVMQLGCAPADGAVSEPAATDTTWWEVVTTYLVAAAALGLVVVIALDGRRRGRRAARSVRARRLDRIASDALLHVHTAAIVRPFVVACALSPLLLLLMRARAHAWQVSFSLFAGIALIVVTTVAAALAVAYREWARQPAVRMRDRSTVLQCAGIGVATLLYAAGTLGFLGTVATLDPIDADVFYTRALQLGSGVSPITPLLIAGTFLALWTQQHFRRAELLRLRFAYEERDDASTPQHRRVRLALTRVWHSYAARAISVALALLVLWILTRLGRSIEAIVLRGALAFDVLHRGLLVLLLVLTVWTVYRLLALWSALHVELRELGRQPWVEAFRRLPESLAGLARLTPVDLIAAEEACRMIQAEVHARLVQMSRDPSLAWPVVLPNAMTSTSADPIISCSSDVRHRPSQHAMLDLRRFLAAQGGTGAAVHVVEEVAALLAVDYVGWVIRHLRHLALQVLLAVVLTTTFLSSYPFEPQSLVRLIFFTLGGVAIVSLIAVLVQTNRDPVLSRVANTNPGELTWDTPFIVNLLVVSAIPILTLLGSEFPEVRDFLFGWLAPILKTVGHG